MNPITEQSVTNRGSNGLLLQWRSHQLQISRRLLAVVAVLTVSATLTAGLWPFHSPVNQVAWVAGENALRFRRHGTALSQGRLLSRSFEQTGCSIELWLRPARIWTTGSVLAFYDAARGETFSVQQDETDLLLQIERRQAASGETLTQMRVEDVFRRSEMLLTITSDEKDTAIYLDGKLATASPTFHLSTSDISGQLILANSPMREHGWGGEVRGLAVYQRVLSAQQVRQNYQSWTQSDDAAIEPSAEAIAVYRFDEHGGRVVHNAVPSAADLEIPKRIVVVDQLRFEAPASELATQPTYAKNVVINILGFVPLGFVAGLCFATSRNVRGAAAAIMAVLAGTALSLTIEYFQSFLPTRFSGETDILTNTLGTAIGVVFSGAMVRYLAKQSASTRVR